MSGTLTAGGRRVGLTIQKAHLDDIAAIEAEARAAALDEARAAVADTRFAFAAYPGDGADGDGPLGLLMDACLAAIDALREGAR